MVQQEHLYILWYCTYCICCLNSQLLCYCDVQELGSVAQWSELGIWMQEIQIPDSDYWMNLSSVTPGAGSPRFVQYVANWFSSYQLGFLTGREGFLNMTLKSPFRGDVITCLFCLFFIILFIITRETLRYWKKLHSSATWKQAEVLMFTTYLAN